eukprot:1160518-Pelagomonas_calceolata.AAC.3
MSQGLGQRNLGHRNNSTGHTQGKAHARRNARRNATQGKARHMQGAMQGTCKAQCKAHARRNARHNAMQCKARHTQGAMQGKACMARHMHGKRAWYGCNSNMMAKLIGPAVHSLWSKPKGGQIFSRKRALPQNAEQRTACCEASEQTKGGIPGASRDMQRTEALTMYSISSSVSAFRGIWLSHIHCVFPTNTW